MIPGNKDLIYVPAILEVSISSPALINIYVDNKKSGRTIKNVDIKTILALQSNTPQTSNF